MTDSAATLTISTRGQLSAYLDDYRLALTPRKIGIHIRLAADEGRGTQWETILIDLWGDDVEPSKRRSLETMISRLRANRVSIHFDCGVYSLRTPCRVDVLATAQGANQGPNVVRSIGVGRWVDELEAEYKQQSKATKAKRHKADYVLNDDSHIAYVHIPGKNPPVVLLGGLATN